MTITASDVRQMLDYDPQTGIFVWKVWRGRTNKIGKVAGTSDRMGYRKIMLGGRFYMAHRLAWLYVHGEWPPVYMDHINGDTSDNRIANLRPATHTQNALNKGMHRNNTSGYKGVVWIKSRGYWTATIQVNGKRRRLGVFDSKEAAHEAYSAAAREHFGEWARS
jgi:hypothetical protein